MPPGLWDEHAALLERLEAAPARERASMARAVRASGLGWTPITWEGWVVTLLPLAAFIAGDLALMARFGVFGGRG